MQDFDIMTPQPVPQRRRRRSSSFMRNACWCSGVSIECIARGYAITDAIICVIQLCCYIGLYFMRSVILEDQKSLDKRVCDNSMKTIDEPDDCEEKAPSIVRGLLLASLTELFLSPLILFGTYKNHVDSCYIWFTFSGLFVFIMPFLQYVFFRVTTWWNAGSYTILAISGLHSAIKLYGMVLTLQYIQWRRTEVSSDQPNDQQVKSDAGTGDEVDKIPQCLRKIEKEEDVDAIF